QPCFHRYTEIGLSYDASPLYGCTRTETACLRQEPCIASGCRRLGMQRSQIKSGTQLTGRTLQ
ncbi:hypothetical protein, partial [uncultured Sphaerochaeta sp.]|uniref:hypothetical protein n=1 Tax=uncultured Sphaerochaeta sp. TaxID=886478 RepID=UPI00262AE700